MKVLWGACAMLACAWTAAYADPQHVQASTTCGANSYANKQEVPLQVDLTGLPCAPASTTAPIRGFGSLSVATSSVLASTLTRGVNSGTWPTTPGIVDVTNDPASDGVLYVCPLGGVCTSSNSIAVLVGQSFRFTAPATTMTFIAASTATAQVQF